MREQSLIDGAKYRPSCGSVYSLLLLMENGMDAHSIGNWGKRFKILREICCVRMAIKSCSAMFQRRVFIKGLPWRCGSAEFTLSSSCTKVRAQQFISWKHGTCMVLWLSCQGSRSQKLGRWTRVDRFGNRRQPQDAMISFSTEPDGKKTQQVSLATR
jgi:hypothetical protein